MKVLSMKLNRQNQPQRASDLSLGRYPQSRTKAPNYCHWQAKHRHNHKDGYNFS